MARKLYIVSVELEELVMAESKEEAEEVATRRNVFQDSLSCGPHIEVKRANTVPFDYEDDSCISTMDGYITFAEAVKVDPYPVECDKESVAKFDAMMAALPVQSTPR